MRNEVLQRVKSAIREPYAWPGGYPVYVVMADGDLLCRDCVRSNYRQVVRDTKAGRGCWAAAGADVYWEGPAEYCGHCGAELASAYVDPDDEVAA